jgi:hypothetical protein
VPNAFGTQATLSDSDAPGSFEHHFAVDHELVLVAARQA